MKLFRILQFLAIGLAVAAATGTAWAQTTPADATPQTPPILKLQTLAAMNALSPSADQVVKLTASGVSEEVVKAYVQNSANTFNLSPDNIINLQKEGVSSTVLAAMINHDTELRANTPPTAPPQPPPGFVPQQPTQTEPQVVTDPNAGALPADYSAYNSQLAPYGTWDYQDGYGWGWQPYSNLGYAYYPWNVLGYGGWLYWPNRGWRWSPHGRGYGPYGGNRGYSAYHGYAGGFYGGNHVGIGVSGRSYGNGTIAPHALSAPAAGGGGHTGGFSGGGHGGFSGGGHR